PSQKILSIIKFEEGVDAVVIDGRNVGKSGKIIAVDRRYGAHTSTVTLQSEDGTKFDTDIDYVFPIGEGKPLKDFTKKPTPKKEEVQTPVQQPDIKDEPAVEMVEEAPGGSSE
ncbi:MAG: hypothetical protein ACW976_04590, partial [Candidatus Ranarchaeia archaeon]